MGSFFSKRTFTEEEMVEVKNLVDKIIADNKVAVFSKTYCPYCKKAKAALKELGVEFFAIELDNDPNGAAIQNYLAELTGQRTVPNIFINQKHVGGCDSLLAAKADGSLQKML